MRNWDTKLKVFEVINIVDIVIYEIESGIVKYEFK